jgi:hypothetical protein
MRNILKKLEEVPERFVKDRITYVNRFFLFALFVALIGAIIKLNLDFINPSIGKNETLAIVILVYVNIAIFFLKGFLVASFIEIFTVLFGFPTISRGTKRWFIRDLGA